MQSTKPDFPPVLVMFFGVLAMSTSSIFIRYAQTGASSLVIATYRLGFATLILTPFILRKYRGELRTISWNDLRLAIISGIFLAAHFATWISSLEYTTVASSVVLVTTTPLWVAMFSPITIREKISSVTAMGLFLALIGTIGVGASDVCNWSTTLNCPPLTSFFEGKAFFGDILALIGALCAAGYVLIGRSLRAKLSLFPYIFIVYGISTIVLLGTVLVEGLPLTGYSSQIVFWIVLLAIFPQLIGHSSYNWALGYLPAAYVSIGLLGEPIGTIILAFFLLKEMPGPLRLIGAILIFIGIWVASGDRKPEQYAQTES